MNKSKKKVAFKWWGDWTLLWVLGGFVLAYFIFIPLKVHPFHWLLSMLGGVVGFGIGLFVDAGLPPIVRSFRRGLSKQARGKTDKKE